MAVYLKRHFLFYIFNFVIVEVFCAKDDNFTDYYKKLANLKLEDYVFWPNGTIPFYITTEHFDKEQSLAIMSSLANFAFKTCLQFHPLVVEPKEHQHVMVFENPRGIRKCTIGVEGHGRDEAHRIILGYDCLKSPNIDMIVMKALGFPFEHNRASRDVFIDVQYENIEPGSISLFAKEKKFPLELRPLPYDVDSVMHFGDRDYSKNGHRTFIFKKPNIKQNRIGLSKIDIRKIQVVYGSECQKRDRLAKIDICKDYPAHRRKREIDFDSISLRFNRDITVPPANHTGTVKTEDEVDIENELSDLMEQVQKIILVAIDKAKVKHCNGTKNVSKTTGVSPKSLVDMVKVVETIKDYAKYVIQNAETNLTAFCEMDSKDIARGRWRCEQQYCPTGYKSTKSGRVQYSTQHRPIIKQSTKHEGKGWKPQYDSNWLRTDNATDRIGNETDGTNLTDTNRRRRALTAVTEATDLISTDTDVTKVVNGEKGEVLRMRTTVPSHKVVNYAPVRRFGRRLSVYSNKGTFKERDDVSNVSLEKLKRHKNVRPKPYRETTERKERGRAKKTNVEEVEEEVNEEDNGSRVEKRQKLRRERKKSDVPETVQLSKANKEFYDERKWDSGVVPYIIAESSKYDIQDMRARLEEVNDILKKRTCVRLQEISDRERRRYKDYLVLDESADYVTGRVGGKQHFGCVELFEGGQHKQHAAMMVMAMLGFYFEVSRHDRDKYIRVHNRHIRADKLHHFEKVRSDATLPVPYDYTSATQPAWQFWRKIGIKGISSIATYKDQDPDGSIMKSLGQNEKKLSDIDIKKINSVYGVKCFENQRRTEIN